VLPILNTPKEAPTTNERVIPAPVTQEEQATTFKKTTSKEPAEEKKNGRTVVLGESVEGRDIVAYQYGTGDAELLLVAGMHGGYSWNTTLLTYQMMDYFMENPDTIPENITVTIVPTLNPDGLYKTVGTTERFEKSDAPATTEETISGRFNANDVDLNRNFDCDWKATSMWQNKEVSGGSKVFSEPESMAVKNYIAQHEPTAVVVWYTSAGGVFSSSCHNGVLPETSALTKEFADASGYPAHEEFNYYEITGDMVNWFAKQNIPAISVLLTTQNEIEFEKNLAGVKAIITHFEQQ